MTALTAERATPSREGRVLSLPVAASKKIYTGALVMLSATGYAQPGAAAVNLIAAGRAEETADNSGGADGAIRVKVMGGVFRFANSASTDAIAITDVGKTAYVVDDQTVAKTDGSSARSAAGKIIDVDAQGVWVAVGIH